MTERLFQNVRIGVLCGGRSPEHRGSMVSGRSAAEALTAAGYDVRLIDMHDTTPSRLPSLMDVAFIAIHGPGGEDGTVQGFLETMGVPYTGSGVLASAVGMHKPTFKELVSGRVRIPNWLVVDPRADSASTAKQVDHLLGWRVFAKPSSGGGSLAARPVHDPADMQSYLTETQTSAYRQFMVEEFVDGTFCTVGLVDIERELTALPVLTVSTCREFYDYEAKHNPAARSERCPADLPAAQLELMQDQAKHAHRLIGAHGWSRVDFLIPRDGIPYLLEVNTVPGLSRIGNMATMAQAAGLSYLDLVELILTSATTRSHHTP